MTSSTTSTLTPWRGEVWWINFDPTTGSEIKKTRPAIVISSDAVGRLPIKLVVPLTDWKPAFDQNIWHVRIDPDAVNGLTKPSAADALQVRSVDIRRFVRRMGRVPSHVLDEISAAIAAVIEHQ